MKFTIYSKDGCPYCSKIQQVFEMTNLKYVVYKLEENFDRTQFYSQFGEGSTFPQVVLDDNHHLGGCSDTIQYLRENNIV
jgi:glutaredoxin